MARTIIIGGGLSGLSLAWHLKRLRPKWETLVLEAEGRPGGKAWTVAEEGFLCEKGVNGVLDNKPSTLQLARDLGLSPLRSHDASRKRFVIKDGRLCKLPENPKEFFLSPLLSIKGKLRLLCEPFIKKGDTSLDETLESFAKRRLGEEAFKRLIDPMATGIYAGDPSKLSLKSCFPRIDELETRYGSLIKAMIQLKKAAKKKGKTGPSAGPGGTLYSFNRGMSELVDTLKTSLGKDLLINTRVESIERIGNNWIVHKKDGKSLEGTHVVLACPAKEASRILDDFIPLATKLLLHIPYPPVSVVSLGFRRESIKDSLDGFGFLAPFCEKRKILGSLWDSSIFSGRAKEGFVLLRTLIGGARTPELAGLSDEKLIDITTSELSSLMAIKGQPEFARIFRWDEAIPQYNTGHGDLIHGLMEETRAYPGLYFRCNWLGGVSLNDCVLNSKNLAREISGT